MMFKNINILICISSQYQFRNGASVRICCWMALFVITIESRRCALRAAASVDSNVELPERCTRALYHNSWKKPNGGVSIRRRRNGMYEIEQQNNRLFSSQFLDTESIPIYFKVQRKTFVLSSFYFASTKCSILVWLRLSQYKNVFHYC
jgi:hypothetical protein